MQRPPMPRPTLPGGVKPVYVLPNLITSASLFSGLCSIILAAQGQFVTACYLILLSAVLDGLDGPVARLTRTTSDFGVEYDSLADVIAFGVAPAFLMVQRLLKIDESVPLPHFANDLAFSVCGLFAICGAIRLARFNTQVSTTEKTHFTGLPIPAAAGTVVSCFLVIENFELTNTRNLHRAILILMLVLAYLMVSTYPFPAPKTMFRRMRGFRGLVTVVVVAMILVAFRELIPFIAFLFFLGYVSLAVVRAARGKRKLASYSPGETITLQDLVDDPEEPANGGEVLSGSEDETPPPTDTDERPRPPTPE